MADHRVRITVELSLDQLQRIFTGIALVCFALFILAIVGEVLGWRNDFGEQLGILTGIIGALAGAIALLLSATKRQVRLVAEGVQTGNRMHGESNRKLDESNRKLDRHTDLLVQQTVLLAEIRDRLPLTGSR